MPYYLPAPAPWCEPQVEPDPRVKYEAWRVFCNCGWEHRSSFTSYETAFGVSVKQHPSRMKLPGPALPTKADKDQSYAAFVKRRSAEADAKRAAEKKCPNPNKEGFKTKESATKALRRFWRTGRGKKMPQRVYPCRCGRWHLTSQAFRGSSNVSQP